MTVRALSLLYDLLRNTTARRRPAASGPALRPRDVARYSAPAAAGRPCRRPTARDTQDTMTFEQAILIIEPDIATRTLYERELGRYYRIFSLPDPRGASKILRAERIAAVVVEPLVPGGPVWDFVAGLKRRARTAPLPVIICSVLDDRLRGRRLDVDAYLIKPVPPAALLAALRPLVAPRRAAVTE